MLGEVQKYNLEQLIAKLEKPKNETPNKPIVVCKIRETDNKESDIVNEFSIGGLTLENKNLYMNVVLLPKIPFTTVELLYKELMKHKNQKGIENLIVKEFRSEIPLYVKEIDIYPLFISIFVTE